MTENAANAGGWGSPKEGGIPLEVLLALRSTDGSSGTLPDDDKVDVFDAIFNRQ